MLWEIRSSLSPQGVVALLEYREEDPKVPIKPLHKMSKSQVMKEYEANGFQARSRIQPTAMAAPDVLFPRRQSAQKNCSSARR